MVANAVSAVPIHSSWFGGLPFLHSCQLQFRSHKWWLIQLSTQVSLSKVTRLVRELEHKSSEELLREQGYTTWRRLRDSPRLPLSLNAFLSL